MVAGRLLETNPPLQKHTTQGQTLLLDVSLVGKATAVRLLVQKEASVRYLLAYIVRVNTVYEVWYPP
jgi:hypothetical protein